MSNQKSVFIDYQPLQKPLKVILGDGRMNLSNQETNKCAHIDAIPVPELVFNLFRITSASKKGQLFWCEIREMLIWGLLPRDIEREVYTILITMILITKPAQVQSSKCKLTVQHQRFGHLVASGLQESAKNKMVNGLQYDWKQEIAFCEWCVQGKLTFLHFTTKQASHPWSSYTVICLWKYWNTVFRRVTFVDDCTRYVWVQVH